MTDLIPANAVVWNIEHRAPRLERVNDGAADEVRRRTGDAQQRGRDESAGGGFGDGDIFATLFENRGDFISERQQILHVGLFEFLIVAILARGVAVEED